MTLLLLFVEIKPHIVKGLKWKEFSNKATRIVKMSRASSQMIQP